MKTFKITKEILDYINKNSIKFSEIQPSPVLGEEWEISALKTYPNVNNGNPVIEADRKDGCFIRLPEQIISHYITDKNV